MTATQSTATESVTAAQATSVSAVKAQEAASIQAIEADSVLAGYVKKDELSSLIPAASTPANTVRVDAAQSFTDAQKLQGQKNLGLIEAIDALITSYGGTVPTD